MQGAGIRMGGQSSHWDVTRPPHPDLVLSAGAHILLNAFKSFRPKHCNGPWEIAYKKNNRTRESRWRWRLRYYYSSRIVLVSNILSIQYITG